MGEKILFISPTCGSCEAVKAHLKKKGFLNRFQIVDVTTPQGSAKARAAGIRAVPNCVIKVGDKTKECTNDEWKALLKGK